VTRRTAAVLCSLAAIVTVGCASALKKPPTVAELGGGGVATEASSDQVEAWLGVGERELAAARSEASVERARQCFLNAMKADPSRVEGFFGAARTTAWLIEHDPDSRRRDELAVEGVQIGQLCLRHHPGVAECTYRLALAVGQQARERPSTANDGLDVMVDLLRQVIAAAPGLDHAGGHRVLALVLLRAPGWPTGPGDPEEGLDQARAAVAAFPDYPPNQLVLGEALLDNGRRTDARRAFERSFELARAADDPEAAEWAAQADEALSELR